MSENTRTTVNVSKESHQAASTVKDEADESWSDVLEFYAQYRADLSVGSNGSSKLSDDRMDYIVSEIQKAQEIAESARDNTEEIKGSMR